jgi:hypothetical protein
VEHLTPHQQWVIQPLIDAGLGAEEVRTLIFRLAFDAIVGEGSPPGTDVTSVVADQPAAVKTAWLRVIGRMISSTEDTRALSNR